MKNNLIRFDWAMKRLLRDKSNYVVLEGFLSTLLGEDLHIVRFLESEANQTEVNDKFNRADMLVEDEQGRLLIIEVQNNHELDYFHRMLYGVSKTISEYINLGDDYDKVRKSTPLISCTSNWDKGKIMSIMGKPYSGDCMTPMTYCNFPYGRGKVYWKRCRRYFPRILRATCK